MKPLMSEKITRNRQFIGDWVASGDHLTPAGVAAFAARIEAARKAIQKQDKVRRIK